MVPSKWQLSFLSIPAFAFTPPPAPTGSVIYGPSCAHWLVSVNWPVADLHPYNSESGYLLVEIVLTIPTTNLMPIVTNSLTPT